MAAGGIAELDATPRPPASGSWTRPVRARDASVTPGTVRQQPAGARWLSRRKERVRPACPPVRHHTRDFDHGCRCASSQPEPDLEAGTASPPGSWSCTAATKSAVDRECTYSSHGALRFACRHGNREQAQAERRWRDRMRPAPPRRSPIGRVLHHGPVAQGSAVGTSDVSSSLVNGVSCSLSSRYRAASIQSPRPTATAPRKGVAGSQQAYDRPRVHAASRVPCQQRHGRRGAWSPRWPSAGRQINPALATGLLDHVQSVRGVQPPAARPAPAPQRQPGDAGQRFVDKPRCAHRRQGAR